MGTTYLTDGDDLTSVANAIRAKSGGSGQLAFPAGFVSEIGNISGGYTVDDLCVTSLAFGTLSPTVDTVGRFAFYGRTGVTALDSSDVTQILAGAFNSCTNMVSVNLPNLTSMRVWKDSTSQSENGNYFYSCSKIESFSAPKLTHIYGSGAFNYCGKTSLVICLPAIQQLGQNTTFAECNARLYDFGPSLTSITYDSFYSRTAARQRNRTLILRRTANVVTAQSTDAIREVTDVYCPNALIASYQNATNWKTRYTGGYITFHAIEGSAYETKYADGTDIPT